MDSLKHYLEEFKDDPDKINLKINKTTAGTSFSKPLSAEYFFEKMYIVSNELSKFLEHAEEKSVVFEKL